MKGDHRTLAEIFWSATLGPQERTPHSVVRHALICLAAFDAGKVHKPSGGQLSMMQLLANLGIEEDLVYASPELVRGESLDERSLVFTIGVLIFEHLTDRHPFGTTEAGRLARLRRGEMGSGVNYFPSVPKELRTILMRAMGPFPEERYASLREMKEQLARFVGEPALAFTTEQRSEKVRPSFLDAETPVKPMPRFIEAPTQVNPLPAQQFREQSIQQDAETVVTKPPIFDTTANTPRPARRGPAPPQKQPVALQPLSAIESEPPIAAAGDFQLPPFEHPQPPDDDPDTEPEDLPEEALVESVLPVERILPAKTEEHLPTGDPPAAAGVPVPSADPLEHPSPRPPRSTEQIDQIDRRTSRLRQFAPLIYGVVGAGAASALFLMIGQRESSIEEPKTSIPKSIPKSKPPASKPLPKPSPPPKAMPASKAAPEEAPDEPSKPPPTKEPKEPAVPAATDPTRRPVLAAADQLITRMKQNCELQSVGGKPFRLAVYMTSDGQIKRGFVSRQRWIKPTLSKCIRDAVSGQKVVLRLPQADFVEWRFRLHPDGADIRVIRPINLR